MKFKHTKEQARKLWIEALRSGEYEQCRGQLCKVDTHTKEPIAYCCLGVLCEVFNKYEHGLITRIEEARTFANPKEISYRKTYNEEKNVLPHIIRKWVGLYDIEGRSDSPHYPSLTTLNDHENYSFKRIAYILENSPLYFSPDKDD